VDLTLYRVGANGRVALGPLAAGVEYFNAEQDPATLVVTLTPVKIVGPSQRTETATPDSTDTPDDPADPAPFA
jgi:hypothetical protein